MHEIRHYDDRMDRLQVVELWRNVFGYETAHNDPHLTISKKIAADDGLFFVAAEDTQIVGTVMAGYDGHRGWLYSVSVHPNKRLRGCLYFGIPGCRSDHRSLQQVQDPRDRPV